MDLLHLNFGQLVTRICHVKAQKQGHLFLWAVSLHILLVETVLIIQKIDSICTLYACSKNLGRNRVVTQICHKMKLFFAEAVLNDQVD